MKGKISLSDFVHEVKHELKQAANKNTGDPFYKLTDVELETSFSVESSGKAGVKFFVDVTGTAKASQTHKVTLKLKVLAPGGSGGTPKNTKNTKSDDGLNQMNNELKKPEPEYLSNEKPEQILADEGGILIHER